MDVECSDKPSIDDPSDAFSENTKLAYLELCKLNGIIKHMKNWHDSREKLNCDIWRLKSALHAVGRDAENTLGKKQLVDRQKEEGKRLAIASEVLKEPAEKPSPFKAEDNACDDPWKSDDQVLEVRREFLIERQRLNNEILRLKSMLREAEKEQESCTLDRLKWKLKEFVMCDQTIEIVFADTVGKVAETIANLSEELVNVSEHLQRSKSRNDDLYREIDRLKAMLRSKSGNAIDYHGRISELDCLTKRLKRELAKFRFTGMDNVSEKPNDLANAERIADDLWTKLRNDREALLTAGDPGCLSYLKKMTDLRVNLRHLHVELEKVNGATSLLHLGEDAEGTQLRGFLDGVLRQIDVEIDKLKDDRAARHCQIDGLTYLKKLEGLEAVVEKTRVTLNSLNPQVKKCLPESEVMNELEELVRETCRKIGELEGIMSSSNCSSLSNRIDELEETVTRLKLELTKSVNRANDLNERCCAGRTTLEQKTKELKDARRRVALLAGENKSLREEARKTAERMLEVEGECEISRKRAEELQQVKQETNVIRRKLQSQLAEREALSAELAKTRNILRQKDEAITATILEKEAARKTMSGDIGNLTAKLRLALEEKEKLLSKVTGIESGEGGSLRRATADDRKSGDTKRSRELARNADIDGQRLKAQLDESRANLDNANREIIELKARLDHFSSDKARLEASNSELESKKGVLMYQLDVEKISREERLKEFTRLTTDYSKLENEKIALKSENERLRTELADLKIEQESMKKSVEDKCFALEDRANKYQFECNIMQHEISKLKASSSRLTSKLEEAETEVNAARDNAELFKVENSKLNENLDELTLKNTAIEARVQVLLTEKNGLTTRINELDAANVALNDQLNKVKTENEYSSIELNKSRIENDKARSKVAGLQQAFDEMKRTSAATRKANDELKTRLNEMLSEYRILDNQLKILRTTNTALKKDRESLLRGNGSLKSRPSKRNSRSKAPKAGKEIAVVENGIFRDKEATRNETRGNEGNDVTKLDNGRSKTSFDKSASNVEKIEDGTNDGLKRLRVENETLKFELRNFRAENAEIRLELSRTKDEFEKMRVELTKIGTGDAATSAVSNKLEIVNLYYKQEVNGFPNRYFDNGQLGQQTVWTEEIDRLNDQIIANEPEVKRESSPGVDTLITMIDKLRIENVALKMEVRAVRCNAVASFTDGERTKNGLRNAVEVIHALKVELTKLRDEKESLKVRLDTARTELDKLKSEKSALKDELVILRKTNSTLGYKAAELQSDYRKLEEMSAGLEGCLASALNEMKKYNIGEGCSSEFDEQLENFLKQYDKTRESLNAGNERNKQFVNPFASQVHSDGSNFEGIITNGADT